MTRRRNRSRALVQMSATVALTFGTIFAFGSSSAFAQRGRGGGAGGGEGGLAGAGVGVYHAGMFHSPEGAASLSSAGGVLTISNIGSSGDDGVLITTGVAGTSGDTWPGWAGELFIGEPGLFPAGASIVVTLRDAFGNNVGGLRLFETNGGEVGIGLIGDVCAPCTSVTMQLLLQGEVVLSTPLNPAALGVVATGAIGNNGGNGVEVRASSSRREANNTMDVVLSLQFPSTIAVSFSPGLPTTDGDELRLSLNGLPPGTRYIGNVMINASDMPSLAVGREGLVAHELTHVAQQGAHILGDRDSDDDGVPDLAITNIGSSGQDGVRIVRKMIPVTVPDITGAQRISARVSFGSAATLLPGSVMSMVAHMVEGGAPQNYGMSITGLPGGQGSVSLVTCPTCCPCSVSVMAIRDGVLVDQVFPLSLQAALAVGNIGSQGSDHPTLATWHPVGTFSDGTTADVVCFEIQNPVAGPVTLTGSSVGSVMADRIRVRITPSDGLAGELGAASLRAGGMSSFTVFESEMVDAGSPDLFHEGLAMSAMGDAVLAPTPDNRLAISNIGSSGQDGVAIQLGEAAGWSGAIDFGPGGGMPVASSVDVRYKATKGKSGSTKLYDDGTESESSVAGNVAIDFEQDFCPTCPIKVELLLHGDVVRTAQFSPPYPPKLVRGAIGSSASTGEMMHMSFTNSRKKGSVTVVDYNYRLHNPEVTTMTLLGQAPADADCVRFTVTGQRTPVGEPVDDCAAITIQCANIPLMMLGGQSMGIPQGFVTKKNNGQLAGKKRYDDGTLAVASDEGIAVEVSNIGSSGEDGCAIDPPDDDCDGVADPADHFDVIFNPKELPMGGRIELAGVAVAAGGGGVGPPVARILAQAPNGTHHAITCDFSSLGSSSFHIEVLTNGSVGHSQGGMTGPFNAVIGSGKFRGGSCTMNSQTSSTLASGGTINSVTMSMSWTGPVEFDLPGQPPVVGDEIRVRGENPTVPISSIASMEALAGGLLDDTFTILDADITPINQCPADINDDDAVNVTDLLAVISGWGACVTCPQTRCDADVSPIGGMGVPQGDCATNVSDLLLIISRWGACP